jgi:hypothetical protein
MRKRILATAFVAALAMPTVAEADADWRGMSCPDYMEIMNGGYSPTRARLIEQLMNTLDAHEYGDRNFWNVVDGLRCECRNSPRTVGEAAKTLAAASRSGLWPNVPLGGTATPAEQRYAVKFHRWIAGLGERPSAEGQMACAYRR